MASYEMALKIRRSFINKHVYTHKELSDKVVIIRYYLSYFVYQM